MKRRLRVGVAVALLVVAGASGCGAQSSSSATSAAPTIPEDLGPAVDLSGKPEVAIDVTDNSYQPRAFIVSPGAKVTFTNKGKNDHNVTPVDAAAFAAIPTEKLTPGLSASITAPKSGTNTFYCSIHGTAQRGQRGAIQIAST